MAMTTAENLRMLDAARDACESTRQAIDSLQNAGSNKTARDLGAALANLLNSVAKQLDAE